ncbi:hypothetical protein M514_11047, partial [Trichuris suis]
MEDEHGWPVRNIKRITTEEEQSVKRLVVRMASQEAERFSLAERYGRFVHLVRVTATCLRFADNCRYSQQHRRFGPLTSTELRNAEKVWFRIAQQEAFTRELALLGSQERLPASSKLIHLDPFLAFDNLLRVGGRIEKAELSYDGRHPIILPYKHVVVDLLIRQCHIRQLHAGTEHTLAVLRQNFWILKGRSAVKRIVRGCVICRRFSSNPFGQKMAPLPGDRITPAFPFERTGVDFAGLLYVKRGNGSRKAYICLFTCMTIRAIHLELVQNMSVEHFLLALRRFIARRGKPTMLQSDNFTTFKASNRELCRLFSKRNVGQIRQNLSVEGIVWKFITERAPWTGGYWERLVRSVKEPLRKVLGRSLLTESEMATVLTEIEAKINARPLTFVGEDPTDTNALTPFHFLIGREFKELPNHEGMVGKTTQSTLTLRQRWKHQQSLIAHFWKRWQKEYTTTLSVRNKWCGVRHSPMVGDVVLVAEENTPRIHWAMGRILEVLPGSDEMVRSARLRTAKGTITRPISKLHLLESAVAL